ncbi:hypothetical protein LOTGIDRAFT_119560 [Lottia gigantea]|uniref:Large ribosomal subunit protein uL23m n=1 Tax=Lottia gigantea TaxID=225164 RepID=V3ZPA6_LOTGI|nr:hypothetical protein LOTGIDRAFT_119560 [Lottia gigantea]ESO93238.1 hypothetical protein LOTGIDRAFT_119560 [Lottia gigantea]
MPFSNIFFSRPLFKRKIPPYPIYWKGDPQLRIYLPLFWMKLLKPKVNIPNDRVHFEIHPQMTKIDVKNYLEKIYNVSVIDVQVKVDLGILIRFIDMSTNIQYGLDQDRKYAFVTLGNGETFTFPDILKASPLNKVEDEVKIGREISKSEKIKYWDRLSIPKWFR